MSEEYSNVKCIKKLEGSYKSFHCNPWYSWFEHIF